MALLQRDPPRCQTPPVAAYVGVWQRPVRATASAIGLTPIADGLVPDPQPCGDDCQAGARSLRARSHASYAASRARVHSMLDVPRASFQPRSISPSTSSKLLLTLRL